MRYFALKLELVSNILWMVVASYVAGNSWFWNKISVALKKILFQTNILIWIYYYPLNGIELDLDLDNSGYEKYFTMLLNNINIWFFTPHNIWPREVKLDCIWTIPLDIINYTKELGNILDVLLIYVTMICNTQSCIKGQ